VREFLRWVLVGKDGDEESKVLPASIRLNPDNNLKSYTPLNKIIRNGFLDKERSRESQRECCFE
jgi:hypothetical protein